MNTNIKEFEIIEATLNNIDEVGIFCIKDKNTSGYKSKIEWFKKNINNGLKIKIAIDKTGKQIGFIEYLPSEIAWRPINAENYLFIQCIAVMRKEARNKEIGSILIQECEKDAQFENKSGVCAVSSDGAWIANKSIYEKNGYLVSEKLGRFELMTKTFNDIYPLPRFVNWTEQQNKYQGWNLIYSEQCPWHEKSVYDLQKSAFDNNILLNIIKLNNPSEAQFAPSGFGTYSLIKDGKLLEDHYLSRTRFENILNKELKN